MGAVVSFAKKVWSGIKKIGSWIWNGIKTVVKKVVKAVKTVVGFIGGIAITIIVTAALVASTVITTVLRKFGLAIASAVLLVLGIAFLTSLIIFGRENKEQNEENNEEERTNVDLGNNRKRDFENKRKKKELDLSDVFLKDVIQMINENIIKKELIYQEPKSSRYSFSIEENDKIKTGKLDDSDDEDSENENNNNNNKPEKAMVSSIQFSTNEQSKLELIFKNEISDFKLGKDILNKIINDNLINICESIQINQDLAGGKFKEIKNISSLQDIKIMKIIITPKLNLPLIQYY